MTAGAVDDLGWRLVEPPDSAYTVDIGGTTFRRPVTTVAGPVGRADQPVSQTRVRFEVSDRDRPRAFPKLQAELTVTGRSDGRTHATVVGAYEPPLRPLGDGMDTLGMHRFAKPAIEDHFATILLRLTDAVTDRLGMAGEFHG